MKYSDEIVSCERDCPVYAITRYDFRKFPVASHRLKVTLEARERKKKEHRFVGTREAGMIASFLTFPRVENIFSDDGRSAAGSRNKYASGRCYGTELLTLNNFENGKD